MNLNDLYSVEHPYYCSDSNYLSNSHSASWENAKEFLNEFEDADVDYNHVFRWDVYRNDDDTYRAEVFIIHQRKGLFIPHTIDSITEDDVDRFVSFLEKHYNRIIEMWKPISKG